MTSNSVEMINLSEFKKVEQANIRKGSKQDFFFKVNVEDRLFTISNKLFSDMELESNGLAQFESDSDVVLAVLPEDQAVFLKKSKRGENKGRSFKNDKLFNALKSKSLITKSTGVQKLDLVAVPEASGTKVYSIINLEV
jgi:hypothetical protein